MATERYTPDQMAEALRQAHGIQAAAARMIGCSPMTVARYIRVYPAVQEAYEDARGEFLDAAETQLIDAVDRGEWRAVRYTLDALGGDRGFGGPPEDDDEARERRRREEWEQAVAEFEASVRKVYGDTPCPPD